MAAAAVATPNVDPWGDASFSSLSTANLDGSAYGRDGVLYFGPPDGTPLQGPGRDRLSSHSDLPVIFKDGRNVQHLSTVIDGLGVTGLGFLNTVFAPVEYSDAVAWEWSELIFAQTLINRSGHEQVPRVVRSGKRAFSAKSQKHDIGMQFEAYFLSEPEGLQHFGLSIQQLRRMIQLTHAEEALYAMFTANASAEAWERANGYTVDKAPLDRLDMERARTFVLQKRGYEGLAQIGSELAEHAHLLGFKYDMIVAPPGTRAHLAFAADPLTRIYRAVSPGGRAMELEAPRAFGSIDGVNIYEAPLTRKGSLAESTHMLDKVMCIGNFVVAYDPHLYNSSVRARTPADRDVRAYDEPADRWGVWHLQQVMANAHLHTSDGQLRPEHYQLAKEGKPSPFVWFAGREGHVAHFWGQCSPEPEDLAKREPGMYLTDAHVDAVARSFAAHYNADDRATFEAGMVLFRRLATQHSAADPATDWTPAPGLATFRTKAEARTWVCLLYTSPSPRD